MSPFCFVVKFKHNERDLKRSNFTTGKRRVRHGTERFPRHEPLRAIQKILRPQQFLLPLPKNPGVFHLRLLKNGPDFLN
jgi:hypothetical protein